MENAIIWVVLVLALVLVVVFFVKKHNRKQKEKTEKIRLLEEEQSSKAKENAQRQNAIGRKLEKELREEVEKRKDSRYVINAYPENAGVFSLVLRDADYRVDVFQISIEYPSKITIVNIGDRRHETLCQSEADFFVRLAEKKAMLTKQISELR